MDQDITNSSKGCPLCATTFTCTPNDCWCSALPPVMPVAADASCYCPDCLKALINKITEQNAKQ